MKAAHSPQPPGALRLVDVDEVGHHAALQQTALRLHPDLRQQQNNSHSISNCLDANLQNPDISMEINLKFKTIRVARLTLRTSVGLARDDDRTPDTTPQKTLMTMVSSDRQHTS